MTDPQPPESSDWEQTLIALYVLAETQLLAGVTAILRRTQPTLEGVQAAVPKMRRLAREVTARLIYTSNPMVSKMITAAVTEGERDAEKSVSKALARIPKDIVPSGGGAGRPPIGDTRLMLGEPFDFSVPHGERAAQAIRDDINSELADVRFRITRLPDDIYKAIAPHGAIFQVLANNVTPAQAQAAAWRVFVSQGVTGFTDVSGRDWALSSYVEMAVRTASTRAYNASHLARMHALGIHYFSVPDDGNPCPLCFPWQGAVLTDGVVAEPEMHVDATIAEATAAGLFHPNCRHHLTAVIPGVTKLPERLEWTPAMQKMYDDSQKQRRLEREVRKAKRALEHAYDPMERKAAGVKVKRAQAKVREHVAATGSMRQSRREQLNIADHKTKLPIL